MCASSYPTLGDPTDFSRTFFTFAPPALEVQTTMSVSTQERIILGTECLPIVVHLQPVVKLSDEQFFDFCQVNRDLRIERNEHGELIIMPPAGSEAGNRNLEIAVQLGVWAKRDG